MATTNVIDGGAMWLFVDGDLVAKTTSHTLSFTMSPRDITNKDSGAWTQILGGLKSAEISFDALYALDSSLAFSDLYSDFSGNTQVTVLAARTYNGQSPGSVAQSSDEYYKASGYITSLEISSAGNGENVTYSGTIQVTGTVSELTVT